MSQDIGARGVRIISHIIDFACSTCVCVCVYVLPMRVVYMSGPHRYGRYLVASSEYSQQNKHNQLVNLYYRYDDSGQR